MNIKSTALLALLVPSIAMLAACNRAPKTDDAATPPAAMSEPAPAADAMPADTAPASTPPADSMGTTSATAPGMSFAEMDKNKDGGIAKDELPATDMLYEHFSVADADGDGKLSEAEVTKHRADMAAAPAK